MPEETKVKMPRRLAVHGMSLLALILATSSVIGFAATEEEFQVSAQVLPRTTLQVRSAPLDLVISARDVRRGYVDVREPTRVAVSNNSPRGYVLFLITNFQGVTALVVREGGAVATLRGGGGAVAERGRVGIHMLLALHYRFILDPRREPGRYPWPVRLVVRPLAS